MTVTCPGGMTVVGRAGVERVTGKRVPEGGEFLAVVWDTGRVVFGRSLRYATVPGTANDWVIVDVMFPAVTFLV